MTDPLNNINDIFDILSNIFYELSLLSKEIGESLTANNIPRFNEAKIKFSFLMIQATNALKAMGKDASLADETVGNHSNNLHGTDVN